MSARLVPAARALEDAASSGTEREIAAAAATLELLAGEVAVDCGVPRRVLREVRRELRRPDPDLTGAYIRADTRGARALEIALLAGIGAVALVVVVAFIVLAASVYG